MPRCRICHRNPCAKRPSCPSPSAPSPTRSLADTSLDGLDAVDRPRDVDSVSQAHTDNTARSARDKLLPDHVLLQILVETLRSQGGTMPLLIVKYDKGVQILFSFADGVWLEDQAQFRLVCHAAAEINSESPRLSWGQESSFYKYVTHASKRQGVPVMTGAAWEDQKDKLPSGVYPYSDKLIDVLRGEEHREYDDSTGEELSSYETAKCLFITKRDELPAPEVPFDSIGDWEEAREVVKRWR